MKRLTFAAAALAAVGLAAAAAQDPTAPPQPGRKAIPFAQPQLQPQPARLPAASRLAQAEEEFETLEAHREVRKAYVRAAEVGVKRAETRAALLAAQSDSKIGKLVSQADLDAARLDLEEARARLEIRLAEMKEVEVRIKFAKKRLDEAKAAVRPPPPGGAG
jgi:hypothetical protein